MHLPRPGFSGGDVCAAGEPAGSAASPEPVQMASKRRQRGLHGVGHCATGCWSLDPGLVCRLCCDVASAIWELPGMNEGSKWSRKGAALPQCEMMTGWNLIFTFSAASCLVGTTAIRGFSQWGLFSHMTRYKYKKTTNYLVISELVFLQLYLLVLFNYCKNESLYYS